LAYATTFSCISKKLVAKIDCRKQDSFSDSKTFCEGYAFGEQHQPPFPSHFVHERGQKENFFNHKVICDPMNVNSFGRPQYYTRFIQGRF
jgi:hypothetical protein